MHARKQIRDAIVALLQDLASTERRVYSSRLYSLDEKELPSISVFAIDATNDEVVTRVTLGGMFHRECPIVIEGHALVDDDIDDVLDQLSLEIEVAMSAPITIGSRTLPAQLRTTSKDLIGDHERQVGLVRLVYLVPYVTQESTPDVLA